VTSAEPSPPATPAASASGPPAAREAAHAGARSAAMVTAGIILSRLFGYARQRVVAHYFGTSVQADAITAGFRIGNITQNLLGEGTLSASFIPVYAKLRAAGRSRDATHFALACLGLLLAAVAVASAIGVGAAPWLAWLVAAGFDAERLAMTARLVRVLFPMTALLVLSAWGLGVLNAHRRFFLPYAAPVVWSLAQIAGLVVFGTWLHRRGEPLAMALAWSALAGGILQLLVLLPVARSLLGDLRPRLDTKDPNVREAGRRLPGVLLGRGVIQISGLVDNLLVSFLGAGAIAVFGYAQFIYLLPMSLLGTGEAAAQLPEMARDAAEADPARQHAALRARLGDSLARITALAVPTTAALAVFGREVVSVLLETGAFTRATTHLVAPVLGAYGLALLGNAAGRVLTTTAFALGDTRTPARFAIYRVVASTAVAIALMRPLGVLGVVLGAVVAAWIESAALAGRLRGVIGGIGLERVPAARVAVVTAACVGAGLGARWLLPAAFGASRLGAAAVLAAFCAAFAVAAPAAGVVRMGSLLRRRR
jgi:putative peptidoglycan lipid II flippase